MPTPLDDHVIYQASQVFLDHAPLILADDAVPSPRFTMAGGREIMFVFPLIVAVDLALRLPRDAAWSDIGAKIEAAEHERVESAVLVELNRARTQPLAFARSLGDQRAYYQGNLLARPGADAVFLTQEGVAPVDEAIAFVRREAAGPALLPAPLLAAAAADHQAEQRRSGMIGHAGEDGSGPSDRVRRRGGDIYVGEVIAYGSTDPADIVRQLVVDDGVADRGHRRLLYDGSLRYAGVSCGAHPVYRYMCVVKLGRTPDGRTARAGTGRNGTDRRS